jgi:hypothetical protein
MTKKSPEVLQAVLDHIASGVVPFTKAAGMADVRPGTFWHWLRQEDDPSLIVSWRGASMQFSDAVKAARREALDGRRADPPDNVVHHYHHVEVHLIDDRAVSGKSPPMISPTKRDRIAEADIDLDDMLGPEPAIVADEREPEAQVVPDNPAPLAFDDFPEREPRTELERFLFGQLAAARAKKATNPSQSSSATEGHSAGSAEPLTG